MSFVAKGYGAGESEWYLDNLSGFDRHRFGHVVSWEACCEIETGSVCGFVLWECCAIVESFDAEDGCVDAPAAGDFDLGEEVGGVWIVCSCGHAPIIRDAGGFVTRGCWCVEGLGEIGFDRADEFEVFVGKVSAEIVEDAIEGIDQATGRGDRGVH